MINYIVKAERKITDAGYPKEHYYEIKAISELDMNSKVIKILNEEKENEVTVYEQIATYVPTTHKLKEN